LCFIPVHHNDRRFIDYDITGPSTEWNYI